MLAGVLGVILAPRRGLNRFVQPGALFQPLVFARAQVSVTVTGDATAAAASALLSAGAMSPPLTLARVQVDALVVGDA